MAALVRTAADILADARAASGGPAPTMYDPEILRWQDPPARDPRGNHRQQPSEPYLAVIAALKLRPGDWAHVFVGDWTRAKTVMNAFIRHGCEAATRRVGEHVNAYARYVGEQG